MLKRNVLAARAMLKTSWPSRESSNLIAGAASVVILVVQVVLFNKLLMPELASVAVSFANSK